MKFPYPCSRCGVCCLNELCPIVKMMHPTDNIMDACRYLSFNGDIASCHLTKTTITIGDGCHIKVRIGDGCCIKARAYKDGVEYNFAALSRELKIKASRQIRGIR